MFSLVLIISQLLFLTFLGIFFRTSNLDTTNSTYLTYGLTLILGFCLMYTPYRKLSLFSLILLLLVVFVSIETSLMFGMFWDSCFSGFNAEVQITMNFLIKSLFGALATMITCLDFLGLFEYWQIYVLISFVMTIGYGLISAIIVYGLNVYDGGGGITVFLFSGICSLMIWFMSVRGKISILQHKKSQSYVNYLLVFIGVAISFFSWPIFNMGGSFITAINTSLSSNPTSLSNSAYINTFSALGTGILCSLMLASNHSQSQKMKPKLYVDCFINSGIIVATYNDLSLDPVCGMTLALFSTILTLILDKHIFQKTDVRNESDVKMIMFKYSKLLFRIIFSFIGVCIAAIVIAARQNRSVVLLVDGSYSQKAGLTIVAWLIALVISAIFGGICAVLINIYHSHRQHEEKGQKVLKIVDQLFFEDLDDQIFPIYKDIVQPQIADKAYEQDLTRRILNQSLLHHNQIPLTIYQSNKKPANHQTNQSNPPAAVQKETIVIKNDFSKSNLQVSARQINLSTMKIPQKEESIADENENAKRNRNTDQRNNESPVYRLKNDESMFQSLKEAESRAMNPSEMKINNSNSLLKMINLPEESPRSKNYLKQENSGNPKVAKKLTYDDEQIQKEKNVDVNKINK